MPARGTIAPALGNREPANVMARRRRLGYSRARGRQEESMDGYPYGWDYGWLACDAADHVAVFTSAGLGPIPLSTIALRPDSDKAERLAERLPVRGECEPNTDAWTECFKEFARRGLYSYDWQDVHRAIVAKTQHYELMARPAMPALVSELPAEVALLAQLARFGSLRFAEVESIALPAYLDCIDAE
jgi:hypothetical protein